MVLLYSKTGFNVVLYFLIKELGKNVIYMRVIWPFKLNIDSLNGFIRGVHRAGKYVYFSTVLCPVPMSSLRIRNLKGVG